MLLLKFSTYIQGGPSCDMGKINASDKIMFENQKKRENIEIKNLLHKSPSKISFIHGIVC